MSMKILQCMFGKGRGGIEQVFVDHTKALVKCGFEVYNACHSRSPYIDQLEKITKKPAYTFTGIKKHNPFIYPALLKTAKQINPDIIFMHGNRAISLFTSGFIKRLLPRDIKLAATTHNYRNKLFNRLDYCLTITEDLKNDLIKRGIDENKIFYCPNAVDLQDYREFQFHCPPVIGTLGRFHFVKGYDILLNACGILNNKGIEFKLTIGGDGELKGELIELADKLGIADKVNFPGWITDKKSFFDNIDIFCLSSRSEGLSLSLLESMAYSNPSIVTDCPGPKEAVLKFNSGFVIEKENSQQLATSFENIINNKDKALEFSFNSRKTIEHVYSFDKLSKRLNKICHKITDSERL